MNGAPSRLFHLGNVVIDIVTRVPHLPEAGGDVLASEGLVTPGGGFNVMAAASRQGLSTIYGGVVGTGPFGSMAVRGLAQEGIQCLSEPEPGVDTGFVLCLVEPSGERTFVTTPGAEAMLESRHLARIAPRPADWVYVSGYSLAHPRNRATLLAWLPQLPEAVTLVFDPGPLLGDIPLPALEAVLAQSHWVTCNAREARFLTGLEKPEAGAVMLARSASRGKVLVRDGPRGCWLKAPDAPPAEIPGFAVVPQDTTGAGDAHTGAFLAALARGIPPNRAAAWANAAAALSVMRTGPATAPTWEETAAWLRERRRTTSDA